MLQKPIKGKRTGLHSHAQKKYFSLMLVPSYSSGTTRSIRISINALYTVFFAILAVIVIVSFLYVRSSLLGRVARDYSAAFEQAYTAYIDLQNAAAQEQNQLMGSVASLQRDIAYIQGRSQEEIHKQQQAYVESLKYIWVYIESLEMRLRQYETYRQEIIEQLSESVHIPIVSNTLDEINQSQVYLMSVLEKLSDFETAEQQSQTTFLLTYSPGDAQFAGPEYAETNLFNYIATLEFALEEQQELFYQLNRQVSVVAPHIRRDRYGPRLLEWSHVRTVMPRNTPIMITDVRTGITYWVNSFSHGNHADVFPVTAEDTAALHRTFNGRWSWDTRPIWVHLDGGKVAASINGMPHGGGGGRGNNMNGHICIHFRGSRTHSGSRFHERDHQSSVTEAFNAGLR